MKERGKMQDRIVNVVFHIIAVLMILMVIYPLWFIIIASFSNSAEVASGNVWILPLTIDLDEYRVLYK